jgi:hypothetical protein
MLTEQSEQIIFFGRESMRFILKRKLTQARIKVIARQIELFVIVLLFAVLRFALRWL